MGPRLVVKRFLIASTLAHLGTAFTPAAETASGALRFGASFVHGDAPVAQLRAVQSGNGILRLFGRAHRDETKAAWPAGSAVDHQVSFRNGAMRGEGVLEIVFGCIEGKVPNE